MNERLAVFWHADALAFDTGAGVFEAPPSPLLDIQMPHPENPERIRNIRSVLQRGPVADRLDWHDGRLATRDEVLRFHQADYLADLEAADAQGRRFSRSSPMPVGGLRAILAAAGTAVAAMEHVISGAGPMAYALVRPPGHHAAPAEADGYCFVNNLAVAVAAARAAGLARLAVVDWDVHHGNGTQEGFYEQGDVLSVSLHMDHGAWGPTHPQSGGTEERGRGAGLGFNLNVPLPMGATDSAYELAMERLVAPAVRDFRPDLLVVANGQDANQFDPNGRQCITMAGFHRLAEIARELVREVCGGQLLIVQEGGYNSAYAAFCAHATVEGFLGLPLGLEDPIAYLPDPREPAERTVAELADRLG